MRCHRDSRFTIHETTAGTYQDLIAQVQIGGSPAFKKIIVEMLNEPELSNLLSTSVSKDACKRERLAYTHNKGPARPQHTDKHDFIRETVGKLLELGVIRTTRQPYYSHIHVAPKPHGAAVSTIEP